MNKVIAICGKICSGKTFYCKKLLSKGNSVLLSCDEILSGIFHHNEADKHDEIICDIKKYLHKKAIEIVEAGSDVILDWGFWSGQERKDVSKYYKMHHVVCEWHYIDTNYDDWILNIEERNQKVIFGMSSDYYVDEGLFNKLISQFEVPNENEIDFWYHFRRE